MAMAVPAVCCTGQSLLSSEAQPVRSSGLTSIPGRRPRRSAVYCRSGSAFLKLCSQRLGWQQPVKICCKSPTSRLRSYAEEKGVETYQGMFGEWSIDDADVAEVFWYRTGLTVAAAGLVLATLLSSVPDDVGLAPLVRKVEDLTVLLGAGGLGVSLFFIHIYVTPLKRFIQALWAVGVLGGVGIMATQESSVVEYVVQNPAAVWFVGPLFAAVTGLAFKEGMCYGKPEALTLFFLTPALLLGHLTGLVPEGGQQALLLAFVTLFCIFAGRKYTQAIKDDIGDKSVFMFQKLPKEQQDARLAELTNRTGFD